MVVCEFRDSWGGGEKGELDTVEINIRKMIWRESGVIEDIENKERNRK